MGTVTTVCRLFTQSDEECFNTCENTPDCRFYFWYPIDYSPSPLYCYLFRRSAQIFPKLGHIVRPSENNPNVPIKN